jgi:hypothetical protein
MRADVAAVTLQVTIEADAADAENLRAARRRLPLHICKTLWM